MKKKEKTNNKEGGKRMNKHLARLIIDCSALSTPLILAGFLKPMMVLTYIGMGFLVTLVILVILEVFTSHHVLPTWDDFIGDNEKER